MDRTILYSADGTNSAVLDGLIWSTLTGALLAETLASASKPTDDSAATSFLLMKCNGTFYFSVEKIDAFISKVTVDIFVVC